MLSVKKTKAGKYTISLEGELDIYCAADFRKELMPLVDECKSAIFNLSGISEMDTSCFQVLMQAKRECERDNKDMQMVSHSPAVFEILELYNMESFFGDPLLLPHADN